MSEGTSNKRWDHIRDGKKLVVVEWRKISVDPNYEINEKGVVRRVLSKRVQKDQKEFRYFEGSVRRSISVRKLHRIAWPEVFSSPKLRRREDA